MSNEQPTVTWKYIYKPEPNYREMCREKINSVCLFINTNYLLNLDDDVERKNVENELRVFLRILYIMNAIFVCDKVSDTAQTQGVAWVTKEHYSELYTYFKNIEYKSPWDGDKLTLEILDNLCEFLTVHFPDNHYFLDACNTPITYTNFKHEINKFTYGIP
jgi:hypothetical protein